VLIHNNIKGTILNRAYILLSVPMVVFPQLGKTTADCGLSR